jgi:Flp pilus assembly pilin Flp
MWKEHLTRFLRDEGGQDVVEYSLLLTVIGAIGLMVLTAVGINVERLFTKAVTLAPYAKAHLDQPPNP